MKKAHIFGKPVIVHVEPDLWGYIQGKSSNPAGTPVAVASSGDSELAGLENNARGLAKAFIKICNTHAPKVIIAWHASQWATNVDLTAQNADGVTIGNSVATFYRALGAKFDLIFFGPSDRDAAWREIVKNQGMDAWWDQDDFNRFRSFIATITKATATKGMIWQIPLGNTSYRTCNNTSGHYQDNRVEYFLEPGNRQKMVHYVNSGIIGMLFGGGFKDQTSVTDVKKDGITNPAPINGNNLVSKFSDDDGGNLRILSKQYYSEGTIARL